MKLCRQCRDRLIHALSDWEDHQRLAFFSRYCEALGDLEQGIFATDFDQERLAQEFFDIFDDDRAEPGRFPPNALSEEDFNCLVAHAIDCLRPERFALVPAVYWKYLPFAPGENDYDFFDILNRCVPPTGSIETDRLRLKAEDYGLECSKAYIDTFLCSDPRFITVRREGKRFAGRRVALLPSIEVIAHNTRRSDYMLHERRPFSEDGERRTYLLAAPRILPGRVKQLVSAGAREIEEQDGFDWAEVGAKMIQIALSPELRIQGLTASLHGRIVEALRGRAGAMSLGDLEQQLGVAIPLSPETLPPGRIMAYAPHPRFLKPENAVYVLSEWVETDTEKRGRILRARIVTPFKEKRWEFEEELAFDICNQNVLYARYRIVLADALVEGLSHHLPDRPTELYFKSQIRRRLESVLTKRMVNLGKGVFASREVAVDRDSFHSGDAWRIETIRNALNQRPDIDLEEFVQKFEDPTLKTQALHAVRGHPSTAYQRY